jgi:hypothetical protein
MVAPSVDPATVGLALLWHGFAFANAGRSGLPATEGLEDISSELGITYWPTRAQSYRGSKPYASTGAVSRRRSEKTSARQP